MTSIIHKIFSKGGPVEKSTKDNKTLKLGSKSRLGFLKSLNPQTTIWIGATVVFAALFFMSSILDMKVHVTFGQSGSTGTVNSQTTSPGSVPPSSGIASQVGGC
jgi:hypothetical protein